MEHLKLKHKYIRGTPLPCKKKTKEQLRKRTQRKQRQGEELNKIFKQKLQLTFLGRKEKILHTLIRKRCCEKEIDNYQLKIKNMIAEILKNQ